VVFDLGDGQLTEVEEAGSEHRLGAAALDGFREVLQPAGATAGDDGHAHAGGDGGQHVAVVAGTGAVGVHAGEEEFSGAQGGDALGPLEQVEAGGAAAAVGEDLPVAGAGGVAPRVDGHHDALAAVFVGSAGDEVGVEHGGGVEGDFVGTGAQQGGDVVDGGDAAADGEGHEDFVGGFFDGVEHGLAALVGGGDVEEHKFVGAGLVVFFGAFDGVAGVAQLDELDAFDDAPGMDIEAGDDALGQHGWWSGEGVVLPRGKFFPPRGWGLFLRSDFGRSGGGGGGSVVWEWCWLWCGVIGRRGRASGGR
jgi:hypothetical protein